MVNKWLKNKILKHAQFPYGRRKVQYQSIPGMKGIRDMEERFKLMLLPDDMGNQTVIDIGCSLGAVCVEAKKRGAGRVVGIDNCKKTVMVAKEYAKQLDLDIEYYCFDINAGSNNLKKLLKNDRFDIVFALSIIKHVKKEVLADMLKYFCKCTCWYEDHPSLSTKKSCSYLADVFGKDSEIKFLGYSTDRGKRANFVVRLSK